jgi:translocation and assembly module TamA
VLPGERDSATHTVPITIATARARRTYSLGAGYGTDTGVRGTFSWLNPRMNTLGHRLRVQVQASQITQTFDVRYDVPFGDPALEKLSLNLTREQQQISDGIDIVENSIKPSITQVRGRWQRVFSLAAVHTVTTDAVYGRIVDDLIVPGVTYASVPEGYLEACSHAVRESCWARTALWSRMPTSSVWTSERTRARSAGELAPAARAGSSAPAPATSASCRRSAAPPPAATASRLPMTRCHRRRPRPTARWTRRPPPHHRHGRIERDLPHGLGAAAFFDFGNAFDRFGDPLAYSVGLGVRWRLPVVTVGIDIAQALKAPGYDSLPSPRLHLNISPRL